MQDRWPHFPAHPKFSFLEESIFRSIEQVLGYLRVLAEELLDAHLKEYLEFAPADLLTNSDLLTLVAERVRSMVNQYWEGYGHALTQEPSSRRAQFTRATVLGTMNEHPGLAPHRYPAQEQWAEFIGRMEEPGSKMMELNARYGATIRDVLARKTMEYRETAISRFPKLSEQLKTAAGVTETTGEVKKLTWENIEIQFKSDHRVRINRGGHLDTKNYAELGFEDRRSAGKPILAWDTLQKLGKGSGEIAVNFKNRKFVETRIKAIRKRFRKEFSIKDDPFEFVPGVGYRCRFKISWSRAADK
jgi:hypothetical protein